LLETFIIRKRKQEDISIAEFYQKTDWSARPFIARANCNAHDLKIKLSWLCSPPTDFTSQMSELKTISPSPSAQPKPVGDMGC
jgi:hypothetical protein